MNATEIILPFGLWIDGQCLKKARLRPLTQEEEVSIFERGCSVLPAQWTTALLTECLIEIGSNDNITPEIIRALNVGDREALLLHLISLIQGDELPCLVSCPMKECGERLEILLKVNDLLLPPYSECKDSYEAIIQGQDTEYRVTFRLPNGGDQEEAVNLCLKNENAASHLIITRCIHSIRDQNDRKIEEIPEKVEQVLPELMLSLDPQAEISLDMICPVCGQRFSVIYDSASYLRRIMQRKLEMIYRHVHILALYYHWSESDILKMSPVKRRRYISLIDESLAGER